jgi:hypothetical protein
VTWPETDKARPLAGVAIMRVHADFHVDKQPIRNPNTPSGSYFHPCHVFNYLDFNLK